MVSLRALVLWFRMLCFSQVGSAQDYCRWCCYICPGNWTRYLLSFIPAVGKNASGNVFWLNCRPQHRRQASPCSDSTKKHWHPLGWQAVIFLQISPGSGVFQVSSLLLFIRDYIQSPCDSCSESILLHPQGLDSLAGLLKVFAWTVLSPLGIWLSLMKDAKNLRLLYKVIWL